MAKTKAKVTTRVANVAGRAAEKVETRILVAEGKRSIKARAATVGKVARKAAKAGMIAGTVVAALVVRNEVKKRSKLAK